MVLIMLNNIHNKSRTYIPNKIHWHIESHVIEMPREINVSKCKNSTLPMDRGGIYPSNNQ